MAGCLRLCEGHRSKFVVQATVEALDRVRPDHTVIRALKKWKYNLIGCPFYVYTDHKTLLNFGMQKDLSHCQVRWMEMLSIYNCKFLYVKGQDNTMANALS